MTYEFHEAANIFPLDDEHLQSLADDIKKNGQQIAIELMDGKILDGRRRSLACKLAGVHPAVRVVDVDDPVAYVLSLNLHRRHLTPSQSSMCAARAREIYERDAKERMIRKPESAMENLPQQKGTARDLAGKAFGVSGKSVDHAKRVLDKGIPELAKAVDSGRMAVSTAAILATEPAEVQKAEVENPKRNRKYAATQGGGAMPAQPDGQPQAEEKPTTAKTHMKTEVFAMNTADVAITQLKGIPVGNDYRDAAFDRVAKWIQSQRKSK
jgi:ParB-like chromosome segregation protein Spo0J